MSKKPQTFTLDPEDDMPDYDDMAFLFFHTATPGYAFADDLNRLYRMALSRQADLKMHGCQWPFYRYSDPVSKLTYLMVERPAGGGGTAMHWKEGHKLLVIQGEDAQLRAQQIRSDFETAPQRAPIPSLADEERARILELYQQELMPVSLFALGEETTTTLSRKAARERAEMELMVRDVVDTLDYLEH